MKLNWLFLCLIFVLLALSFSVDMWGEREIKEKIEKVDKKFIDKTGIATPMLAPKTKLTQMSCNECHSKIVPGLVAKKSVPQHPDIVLAHGINDTCLNCHDKYSREWLRSPSFERIDFAESEKLCASCHATQFRDWNIGVHGRLNGYWDKTRGEQTKLTCVACHNPHAPGFKSVEPAPAPHYLHRNRSKH